MLNLRTELTPLNLGFWVEPKDAFFGIGSCFTENMSQKLTTAGFSIFTNPNGIVFNPFSMLNSLQYLMDEPNEAFFLNQKGGVLSWLHHGSFLAKNAKELTEKIKTQNSLALKQLAKTNYILLTPGTAFYYKHKELNIPVANCHKISQQQFEKILMSPNQVTDCFEKMYSFIKAINKNVKFICTLSPVRHLKDGLHENNLSKSSLLLGLNQFLQNKTDAFYFPAFELVNDDLRDYRFYAEDLAHPNHLAVNYIWEKFTNSFFSEKALHYKNLNEKLHLAQNHKVLSFDVNEHEKFKSHIEKLKKEIDIF